MLILSIFIIIFIIISLVFFSLVDYYFQVFCNLIGILYAAKIILSF